MSLIDRINADLKQAMLARDAFLTGVLRDLKSAFLYEAVAKQKKEEGLSEDEMLGVIARECKKRDDAIEIYTGAGNKEAAQKEAAEREILMAYLPEQLSEDEVADVVSRVIETTGATDVKDLGRVIGAVKAELGAKADGAVIAKITKEKLS